MRKFFPILLAITALFFGFWMGSGPKVKEKKDRILKVDPEREYPIISQKAFAFIIYACDDAPWCERTLRSIFEQNYETYRILFVDDASMDGTWEKARHYVVGNNQEDRVILLRNEERIGKVASFYKAVDQLVDAEIVIPIDGRDWLAHENFLGRLNSSYQNPDVWITFSPALSYPDYSLKAPSLSSFYAALFKQIRLSDLYRGGEFVKSSKCWENPLIELAGGRGRITTEPYRFSNAARPNVEQKGEATASYQPLVRFPAPISHKQAPEVDLLLFSFDRPLQLYACLESIQRYVSGIFQLKVLYRCSDERYAAAYEEVKRSFPDVVYNRQSSKPKRYFKENVLKLLDSPSPYIVFGVDDIIVKDEIDLIQCAQMLEKSGAYGFFLRLGQNTDYSYVAAKDQPVPPSVSLSSDIYAWDFKTGSCDWNFHHNLDMTVYKKSDVFPALEKGKFDTPNSMEQAMAEASPPEGALGLYFEQSKIVNIPLNVTSPSRALHMNFMTTEELLAVFNQGLKIDIGPFYRVSNRSPHFEQVPEFSVR